MNKIILIGRLTKDIEVKTSQSGTELARFSLAVTRPFKNKQSDKYETDFFDCVVWRQAASLLAKYCHKGDQLAIEGWMSINDYVDKSTGEKRRTYEVNVEKFDFGAKSSGNPTRQRPLPLLRRAESTPIRLTKKCRSDSPLSPCLLSCRTAGGAFYNADY